MKKAYKFVFPYYTSSDKIKGNYIAFKIEID